MRRPKGCFSRWQLGTWLLLLCFVSGSVGKVHGKNANRSKSRAVRDPSSHSARCL